MRAKLQELRTEINEVSYRASRHKRATNLRQYLLDDLEYIDDRTELVLAQLDALLQEPEGVVLECTAQVATHLSQTYFILNEIRSGDDKEYLSFCVDAANLSKLGGKSADGKTFEVVIREVPQP